MWLALLLAVGCNPYDAGRLPAERDPSPPPESDGGDMTIDGGVDPNECRPGGESMCSRANADATCVDGVCLIVRCREPFLDCDGERDNGCEATLDTPQNCGACRASCTRAHVAYSRCDLQADEGPCLIDHSCPVGAEGCIEDNPSNGCEQGFGDCDGRADNGCETSLRTLSDCGGCGVACASADSEVDCDEGRCVEIGCAPGFGECGDSGCESLASDPAHCGACDQACTQSEAMCYGGRCTSLSCEPGTADCDGASSNQCETDLGDVETCGSCDVSCGPYPRAQAGCGDGQCMIVGCDPGYGDCDAHRNNGCEVDLLEVETCGGCGNDCSALPHVASAICGEGVCAELRCEDGWDDCDGNPDNGCEQSLRTAEHCGGCNQPCERDNATTDCSSGTCVVSACDGAFDDCNGQAADGCEAALDSDRDCGSCGNACADGMTCQGGGCACSAGVCAEGTECCDGACVNTNSVCFPWPCIPGTRADRSNCGGCGVECPLYCCLG